MPASVRFGDICTGHPLCYPPRPNDQGSPNVFVNGLPKHRLTDHWVVHCLAGSTKIRLLSGNVVAIEDLVDNFEGEFVYSCTADGRIIPGKIVDAFISGYTNTLSVTQLDNTTDFSSTGDHLLMLHTGEYLEAKSLNATYSLMGTDDNHNTLAIKVTRVETLKLPNEVPVYDLTISNEEGTHNFALACGVFVHNCCGFCHDSQAASGSPNVFTNSLPACRIGDAVACGSAMATGSPNVFINGG